MTVRGGFNYGAVPQPKRKRMQRPPALYVVYAKSKDKRFCGCPFALLSGKRFHGFEFRYYKRAIEYTKRFRAEWAAENQVKRLDQYYNKHRDEKSKIIFKIFKVEAKESWDQAEKRWVKEYEKLKVPGMEEK